MPTPKWVEVRLPTWTHPLVAQEQDLCRWGRNGSQPSRTLSFGSSEGCLPGTPWAPRNPRPGREHRAGHGLCGRAAGVCVLPGFATGQLCGFGQVTQPC